MAGRLTEAIDERDRARDTAIRLEAELARGHRIAAPDVTLTRTSDGAPGTPDEAVPGPSGALGRPGSENTPTDTYPHKIGTRTTCTSCPDASNRGGSAMISALPISTGRYQRLRLHQR